MLPGLGGMNPAQMKKMMNQLGIKSEDLDVKRVIFEMDNKKLVIENPQVNAINMQGTKTYSVIGEATEESLGIPQDDIDMVAEQTGVSKEEAKKALEETSGDLAEAIAKLKTE